MSIRNGFEPGMAKLEPFLRSVGRRKFLKPLYLELMKTSAGAARAREIYCKARAAYHPIAQNTIDSVVGR
jgi:hypothetical protein